MLIQAIRTFKQISTSFATFWTCLCELALKMSKTVNLLQLFIAMFFFNVNKTFKCGIWCRFQIYILLPGLFWYFQRYFNFYEQESKILTYHFKSKDNNRLVLSLGFKARFKVFKWTWTSFLWIPNEMFEFIVPIFPIFSLLS